MKSITNQSLRINKLRCDKTCKFFIDEGRVRDDAKNEWEKSQIISLSMLFVTMLWLTHCSVRVNQNVDKIKNKYCKYNTEDIFDILADNSNVNKIMKWKSLSSWNHFEIYIYRKHTTFALEHDNVIKNDEISRWSTQSDFNQPDHPHHSNTMKVKLYVDKKLISKIDNKEDEKFNDKREKSITNLKSYRGFY